jgi:hypothetical protein
VRRTKPERFRMFSIMNLLVQDDSTLNRIQKFSVSNKEAAL